MGNTIQQSTPTPITYITGWVVRPQRGDYCPLHKHVSWELVFHQHGSGRTTLADGRVFNYEPKSMVLYGAQVEHEQHSYRNDANHCVHLQLPETLALQLPDCMVSPPIRDSDLISNVISLCHTRLPKSGLAKQALDHQASFVLLRYLQYAQQEERKTDSSIQQQTQRARHYIQENFRRIESVRDVARHLKMGYDNLRKQFPHYQGMSLNQCLTQARIQRAEQLLEHSTLTCAEIAQMTGFANERYFNTCFKNNTGKTPGQYRKQVQS